MSIRGAEFRKTDLQIHSPRDRNWEGPRPEDVLGDSPSELEVKDARVIYCKSFINKCIEQSLGAIAITDHHEGVYAYEAIEVLADLKTDRPELDLWIFPGMELTCKDSCQALIIFDADLPLDLFNKARAKLSLPSEVHWEQKTGIEPTPLEQNIEDLQDLLEDEELNGRFILLPHIKPGGYKTVLRKGFHKRFNQLKCVGGYMDKTYPSELDAGDRRILDGKIPDWTSEPWGAITCSDSRYADFHDIGNYATWIKMATPTAESLRQALLAPDSRIRYSEPILPEAVISSIDIKGSAYLKDGVYRFNQQMNSIIGGRGAGKSTLLEYIRFALGCSAIDNTSSPNSSATQRLKDILNDTLLKHEHSEIQLNVLLNGAEILLKRTSANREAITIIAKDTSISTVEDVRELIPTQQYRQGQLSDLAREDAEESLLKLITAAASSQIKEIEQRLKRNAQDLSEAVSRSVRLSSAKHTLNHSSTRLKLLEQQIANLEEQIEGNGQSTLSAINEHPKYLDQDRALNTVEITIRNSRDKLNELLESLESELTTVFEGQPIMEESQAVTKLFTEVKTESISDTATNLKNWLDATETLLEQAREEWAPLLQSHNEAYDNQLSSIKDQESTIKRLEELRNQRRDASKKLTEAEAEVYRLQDADSQLDACRDLRGHLESNLSALIKSQSDRLKEASSNLAFGKLADYPNSIEIESAIKGVFNLHQMRASRLEKLLNLVMTSSDKISKWKEIQNESLSLLIWKEGGPEDKDNAPDTPILSEALGSFMDRLKESLTSDNVATLLKAIFRPRVEIFHIRDGKSEIKFSNASQGEQAATLLNVLLNQNHGPLLIDQPEEDLDNKIINDIIKTMRGAKDRRQLILATHNANITVNGDSENVIELELGEQNVCGAIDEPDVKSAITETMEGGKIAFELRRKKYNF